MTCPSRMNFTFWWREEGIAPALWIQGWPSSKLKDVGIPKTWNKVENVVGPIYKSITKVPITSLSVLSYTLTVLVEGPKSEGAKPRRIAVAKRQTFKAEPLSNKTDGTLWSEQPTVMYRGCTWYKPSGGKLSSENTMQVTLSIVIIWINPSGMVVVSTLIWLKARIKTSLWVLNDANKLQIEIRAWVLYNCLKPSSSSLITSSWEVAPSNSLTAGGGGWAIFPLWVTICISLPSESSFFGHKVNETKVS